MFAHSMATRSAPATPKPVERPAHALSDIVVLDRKLRVRRVFIGGEEFSG